MEGELLCSAVGSEVTRVGSRNGAVGTKVQDKTCRESAADPWRNRSFSSGETRRVIVAQLIAIRTSFAYH